MTYFIEYRLVDYFCPFICFYVFVYLCYEISTNKFNYEKKKRGSNKNKLW